MNKFTFFFLFLRLLRCFSSPGSLPCVMDSRMDTGGLLRWVPPFRHLRIVAHLQLPAAFRSLSRLSSALSAKASTLCSFLLNLSDIGLSPPFPPSVAVLRLSPDLSGYFALQIFFAVQIHLLCKFTCCTNFVCTVHLSMYSSDVLYISFANLIFKINFQYSVFKVQICPYGTTLSLQDRWA